jgi:Ala-tRNA(Pro) deacylase
MNMTDEGLFARLDGLGIVYRTHCHPPLFTVEESQALRGTLPGLHIKNLFLRDKKKKFWLVTALEDRKIDLKALRRRLGAKGSLSFGSPELLMTHLGVAPGAVTPFGIINDRAGNVSVVLDQALLGPGPLNAHPLRNDRTTALAPGDLVRFLEAESHAPLILDFDALD